MSERKYKPSVISPAAYGGKSGNVVYPSHAPTRAGQVVFVVDGTRTARVAARDGAKNILVGKDAQGKPLYRKESRPNYVAFQCVRFAPASKDGSGLMWVRIHREAQKKYLRPSGRAPAPRTKGAPPKPKRRVRLAVRSEPSMLDFGPLLQ